MSHITNCPICGRAYMASSEESANSPDRECYECWDEVRDGEQLGALELDRRIEADEGDMETYDDRGEPVSIGRL